jgi:trk system potassium uptake protein
MVFGPINGGRHGGRPHHYASVQRVMGQLLMIFSITLLPPIGVSWYYGDGLEYIFGTGLWVTLASGAAVWWPVRNAYADLKIRDGFLVVVLFWLVLGLYGAIPLYLSPLPDLTFPQAVFESVSGLTTTGATVLLSIDALPRSILYYRQQLHFLGGMGIIVLAVAILPMLGVGGMQLYRAETAGPARDTRLTPRIRETARALWAIYVGLNVVCTLAYWAAGMSLFDAICHSFSTVATGGFSTHSASIAWFNSPLIEYITVVFMILGAMSFALHFIAWRNRSPLAYFRDPEFTTFLMVGAAFTVTVAVTLYFTRMYVQADDAFRFALFQVVSLGTTTGYTTTDYSVWPLFLPPLLIFASFILGCAGSTAGGMKMVRVMLLFKQGIREVVLMIHPNAELPIKVGHRTVPDRVVQAVWGFFSAYMGFFVILLLLMLASGLDIVSAVAAVVATLNNLGPGLGAVNVHFYDVNAFALWTGTFAMILGRLELFPILVLLTPAFWRR